MGLKKIVAISIILCLIVVLLKVSYAEGYSFIPYKGYTYNEYGQSIPSAVGYCARETYFADAAGESYFNKPADIFFYNDMLFVLNQNNITILDDRFNIIRKIDQLILTDGTSIALSEAKGIYVTDDKILIADPVLEMVVVCDLYGNVSYLLKKPENELYPQEKPFRPIKVLVDKSRNIYVLGEGIFQGAVVFNKGGKFLEYFGSNRVGLNANILLDLFWRRFMTEEQISASARNVPVEYTNFDIDDDGFVFTCTAATSDTSEQIRKLNPAGVNVFPTYSYGDIENIRYKTISQKTSFVDISVNIDGFIFAADESKGRIFMYDSDGLLVSIFGGSGIQTGRFQSISAIETFGRSVYVADRVANSITVFDPTQYGQYVYDATLAYIDGRYHESKELWENVLKQNANYQLAYVNIGKTLYLMGDYKQAMDYFELGADRKQISQAFSEMRKSQIRRFIGPVISASVLLTLVLTAVLRIRKRLYKRGQKS